LAAATEYVTPDGQALYTGAASANRMLRRNQRRWEPAMLDDLGILFSTGIMFLVIVRAVQLDSLLPWFAPSKSDTGGSGSGPKSGARTNDGRSGDRPVWRRGPRGKAG
jgi:hypothetical protein